MTSPTGSEPATGHQLYHGEALAPVTATKVVATAILAVYVVQLGLFGAGVIELGAAAGGFVAVLGGVLLWARQRGFRLAHLGVRKPPMLGVVAAVLIGLSAWFVNLCIVALIKPPGDSSKLQQVVEATPLVPTLLGLALMPAVTEEIVFRGIFTRALATRFAAVHAIGFSAAVFALYHLLPAQMISTFGLGLVLGFVTLRSDSAIPAMIAHALNNTIAVIVSREEVPGLTPWMSAHGGLMLAGTSALLAGGIAIAAMTTRGGAA